MRHRMSKLRRTTQTIKNIKRKVFKLYLKVVFCFVVVVVVVSSVSDEGSHESPGVVVDVDEDGVVVDLFLAAAAEEFP